MTAREILQRLGVGRLAYVAWHAPLGRVRRCIAEGGPIEQWRTELGRRAMLSAARELPPLRLMGTPLELHVLTGRRFWYQTAFCLWTFSRQAGRPVMPVIYDDGTLDSDIVALLRGTFPSARFVPQTETLAEIEKHLPAARYPNLRERWKAYPNIRKLIDVHVGKTGWKLVLDSDLLFFRRPDRLMDWLAAPNVPLVGIDCVESYGYPRVLLERLTRAPLPAEINVGICGLKSDALDWDLIEHWISELHREQGTHYYLEQALVAMLLSGHEYMAVPASEYRTNPSAHELRSPHAVMYHYVAQAKRGYFRQEWKRAMTAGVPNLVGAAKALP